MLLGCLSFLPSHAPLHNVKFTESEDQEHSARILLNVSCIPFVYCLLLCTVYTCNLLNFYIALVSYWYIYQ